MRKNFKLLGAVAVAGLVAATGSAFTGTGLDASGTADVAQFVGGTVTQTVTGATLSEIRYSFSDAPSNTLANSVLLTFDANAVTKPVTIVLNGNVTVPAENCAAVADTNPDAIATAYTSTCTFTAVGVNSIAVTVGGDSV